MVEIQLNPIATFTCNQEYPQLAPRQGTLNNQGGRGIVHFQAGQNFEQGLSDLHRFDKIWLIYLFDRNSHWKPKVNTPRGGIKRGLFATRAPYRPNPIGLSCVTLIEVRGLKLIVEDFDLLDNTPILDVKPYLPYADSFPNASQGWLEDEPHVRYSLEFTEVANQQINWVGERAAYDLRSFILTQLGENPLDDSRKRVKPLQTEENIYVIAARTWRVQFEVKPGSLQVQVRNIESGYTSDDLMNTIDKYADKEIHREFIGVFRSKERLKTQGSNTDEAN